MRATFIGGFAAAVTLILGLVACSATVIDNPNLSTADQEVREQKIVTPQLVLETDKSKRPQVGIHKGPHPRVAADTMHRAKIAYASGFAGAPPYQDYGRENYQAFEDHGIKWVEKDPVSTFSIDVDSASYANVRRSINEGFLPNRDAVRVEELINYFSYQYPAPDKNKPFSIYQEVGPAPWDTDKTLLHVAVNSKDPEDQGELPPANLVFLIDVSGSMQAPNKLHLLKRAMKMLVRQMRPEDTVGIAVYAGAAGEVLAPTSGAEQQKIMNAIDRLSAGGSTNGAAGIHLAYQMAQGAFIKEGINRVMLATDGDFNVGTADVDGLEALVERKRKSGVALSVLGFGTGNLNDHMMQKIAQVGNGNAAYIDSMQEARKVLVDELGATINTVAKDVKIQIEFNPKVVESYRLIGYETRHLNREDFNNDKVDAGEVGEGHTVTALYELSLVGSANKLVDPLRYQEPEQASNPPGADAELAFVKVRYKEPDAETSKLHSEAVRFGNLHKNLANTSTAYQFSAAVAWFGQSIRGNKFLDGEQFDAIVKLAKTAKGQDEHGYRSEFIQLVQTASVLAPETLEQHYNMGQIRPDLQSPR